MKSKRHNSHYFVYAIVTLFTVLLFSTCNENPHEPDKTRSPMLTGTVSDNAGAPLQGVGVHFLYGDHTNILQKNIPSSTNNMIAINDTGVVEVNMPDSTRLFQNYPNPFNPTTTISYSLAEAINVNLTIFNWPDYDTVCTLINSHYYTGMYTMIWDGKNNEGTIMTNGFYPVRLTAGAGQDEKIMCIQSVDTEILESSKTDFVTNSNGKFTIDYKYIPIGEVISITLESGPELIDTFTIPDSIYIILTKPGYTALTQKVLIDTTQYVNIKFTLLPKP